MKNIHTLLLAAIIGCAYVTDAGAQAQISTRKVLVGDFTSKVTKVVTGSDAMLDDLLKSEVAARWRVSPYEFCTLAEYDQIKNDPNYYFLMLAYGTDARGRRNGVTMISLSKGGLEKKVKDSKIPKAIDLCNFPIASSRFPNGREAVWMAAAIDIIQTLAVKSTESDFSGYGGLKSFSSPWKCRNSSIAFSEDDLSPRLAEEIKAKIEVMEDADELLEEGGRDTLVSFVVAPSDPVKGSPCYKMLINARTHELLYFNRARISSRKPAGFDDGDIKRLGIIRKTLKK